MPVMYSFSTFFVSFFVLFWDVLPGMDYNENAAVALKKTKKKTTKKTLVNNQI